MEASEPFRDRADAGRQLAKLLEEHRGTDAVVLGITRGGVPVAFEVAGALKLPLDVFVVRKLGVPGQPELAAGAVASGGTIVLNEEVAGGIDDEALDQVGARELAELQRREHAFLGSEPALDTAGRKVILVDDGIATGSSMLVAVRALRAGGAGPVIVAVPVCQADVCYSLREEADEVVSIRSPDRLVSVGSWYRDFDQTEDENVRELLARSRNPGTGDAA